MSEQNNTVFGSRKIRVSERCYANGINKGILSLNAKRLILSPSYSNGPEMKVVSSS